MILSNQELAQNLYVLFGQGDMDGLLALCTDDITFTVPGGNQLAGVHTKSTFHAFIGKVMELSAGTFREDIIDILVSKERVFVLLNHWLERDGQQLHYLTSHLWQLRGGKFCQWHELPLAPIAFNRSWS